eukprot:874888_1
MAEYVECLFSDFEGRALLNSCGGEDFDRDELKKLDACVSLPRGEDLRSIFLSIRSSQEQLISDEAPFTWNISCIHDNDRLQTDVLRSLPRVSVSDLTSPELPEPTVSPPRPSFARTPAPRPSRARPFTSTRKGRKATGLFPKRVPKSTCRKRKRRPSGLATPSTTSNSTPHVLTRSMRKLLAERAAKKSALTDRNARTSTVANEHKHSETNEHKHSETGSESAVLRRLNMDSVYEAERKGVVLSSSPIEHISKSSRRSAVPRKSQKNDDVDHTKFDRKSQKRTFEPAKSIQAIKKFSPRPLKRRKTDNYCAEADNMLSRSDIKSQETTSNNSQPRDPHLLTKPQPDPPKLISSSESNVLKSSNSKLIAQHPNLRHSTKLSSVNSQPSGSHIAKVLSPSSAVTVSSNLSSLSSQSAKIDDPILSNGTALSKLDDTNMNGVPAKTCEREIFSNHGVSTETVEQSVSIAAMATDIYVSNTSMRDKTAVNNIDLPSSIPLASTPSEHNPHTSKVIAASDSNKLGSNSASTSCNNKEHEGILSANSFVSREPGLRASTGKSASQNSSSSDSASSWLLVSSPRVQLASKKAIEKKTGGILSQPPVDPKQSHDSTKSCQNDIRSSRESVSSSNTRPSGEGNSSIRKSSKSSLESVIGGAQSSRGTARSSRESVSSTCTTASASSCRSASSGRSAGSGEAARAPRKAGKRGKMAGGKKSSISTVVSSIMPNLSSKRTVIPALEKAKRLRMIEQKRKEKNQAKRQKMLEQYQKKKLLERKQQEEKSKASDRRRKGNLRNGPKPPVPSSSNWSNSGQTAEDRHKRTNRQKKPGKEESKTVSFSSGIPSTDRSKTSLRTNGNFGKENKTVGPNRNRFGRPVPVRRKDNDTSVFQRPRPPNLKTRGLRRKLGGKPPRAAGRGYNSRPNLPKTSRTANPATTSNRQMSSQTAPPKRPKVAESPPARFAESMFGASGHATMSSEGGWMSSNKQKLWMSSKHTASANSQTTSANPQTASAKSQTASANSQMTSAKSLTASAKSSSPTDGISKSSSNKPLVECFSSLLKNKSKNIENSTAPIPAKQSAVPTQSLLERQTDDIKSMRSPLALAAAKFRSPPSFQSPPSLPRSLIADSLPLNSNPLSRTPLGNGSASSSPTTPTLTVSPSSTVISQYEMSDYRGSDSESDSDSDSPRKYIPHWCREPNLGKAINRQWGGTAVDPDTIFMSVWRINPKVAEIFGYDPTHKDKSRSLKARRDSRNWQNDTFNAEEEKEYKRQMGYANGS